MRKCVMFDFDGVIVDSERYALELLVKIFRDSYRTEITEEDGRHVIGFNTNRTIDYLNSVYGTNVDVDDFIRHYMEYDNYYTASDELKAIDGAEDCLRKLNEYGYKVGLVSSTRSLYILSALNRLNLVKYFHFIVTGDMVKESKPAPEPYLKGALIAGVSPDECVVVEDSPAGIESARSAGMFAIAFKAATIKLDTEKAYKTIFLYKELGDYLCSETLSEQ